MILPGPNFGSTRDAEARREVARLRVIAQVGFGDRLPELLRRGVRGGLPQRHAGERRAQRNRLAVELHFVLADRRLRHEANHLFGHRHQVLVVAVGLIELEHRELGIVPRRDAFVAEIAVDLVHALEAAHDQPLEIQLGRDAQKQIDVERVVMRAERPRHRAAGNRLHHRRLDLEIPAAVEELAQRREHLAAHLEHFARLGIDDEIEIALAIADLDVGQAVPLLRQRQMALRQKLEARRPDRQLVGARAEQMPFDADDVAEIEQPEHLEIALRERVLPDVDLDARSAVGQHQKIRLAEAADAENAAARDRVDACGLRARVRSSRRGRERDR